jgi:hypothetical protein
LINPGELTIMAVRDRHDQARFIYAEPGSHLWERTVWPVIGASQQAAEGSALAAYRRRGRAPARFLAIGSDHHWHLALGLEADKDETHGLVARNGSTALKNVRTSYMMAKTAPCPQWAPTKTRRGTVDEPAGHRLAVLGPFPD